MRRRCASFAILSELAPLTVESDESGVSQAVGSAVLDVNMREVWMRR